MADIYTGIIFENRHSYHDFGAFLSSAKIGYPKEIKIKERVPYSNFVYDFSHIFSDFRVNNKLILFSGFGMYLQGKFPLTFLPFLADFT